MGADNAHQDGFIGIRPEHVTLHPAGEGLLNARVEMVESLGSDSVVYVTATATAAGATGAAPGVSLVAKQNMRSPQRVGDVVGVAFAPSSFHRFDAQGRAAIRSI